MIRLVATVLLLANQARADHDSCTDQLRLESGGGEVAAARASAACRAAATHCAASRLHVRCCRMVTMAMSFAPPPPPPAPRDAVLSLPARPQRRAASPGRAAVVLIRVTRGHDDCRRIHMRAYLGGLVWPWSVLPFLLGTHAGMGRDGRRSPGPPQQLEQFPMSSGSRPGARPI